MMRRKRISCILAVFFLLAAPTVIANAAYESSGKAACPSANGSLQVIDGYLADENAVPVQLRGISTHGLAWYPEYVNQSCIAELKDWGANLLRLALYTAESGGYCTDGDQETLKDLIRAGVDYATEADMYVIVDWHVLSEGTPAAYQSEAAEFFDEMSAEFADHVNVLYEICNEPNTAGWPEIKSYAKDIIPIIRANDPDAVIIVGTPTWSQDVDQAAADPITDWDNIMYSLHFYAATHGEELRQKMCTAADEGLPIFVTEYGICDASGSGKLDFASADEWIRLMDEYGISYAAWNLSNKDESSAILNPDVTKVLGFDYEDLSASGKWVYSLLSGEQTELYDDTSDAQDAGIFTEDGLMIESALRSSWEDDGSYFYLYDLTLTNNTGSAISDWRIRIDFNEKPRLSDGWNADIDVSGNSLILSNADYNGSLGEGESVTDIGFIAEGSESLTLIQEE